MGNPSLSTDDAAGHPCNKHLKSWQEIESAEANDSLQGGPSNTATASSGQYTVRIVDLRSVSEHNEEHPQMHNNEVNCYENTGSRVVSQHGNHLEHD